MKTLIINAHPLVGFDMSFTNQALDYTKTLIGNDYTQIDLDTFEIPRLNSKIITIFNKMFQNEALTEEEQKILNRSKEIINQFKEHKNIIIFSPLYNLNITSQLKDYIDTIVAVGETFKYTEQGPVGLLSDDYKVTYVQASGSIYTNDDMYALADHAPKYINSIMNFMGIKNINIVRIEGTALLNKEDLVVKMKKELDVAFK